MLPLQTLALLGGQAFKWGLWAACCKLFDDSVGQLVTRVEVMMAWLPPGSLKGTEQTSTMLNWAEQAGRALFALAMPLLRFLRST